MELSLPGPCILIGDLDSLLRQEARLRRVGISLATTEESTQCGEGRLCDPTDSTTHATRRATKGTTSDVTEVGVALEQLSAGTKRCTSERPNSRDETRYGGGCTGQLTDATCCGSDGIANETQEV